MKVSELTGAELDYWVAMADELPIYDCNRNWPGNGAVYRESCERPIITIGLIGIKAGLSIENLGHAEAYAPSREWSQGGPIIERERIAVFQWTNRKDGADQEWHAAVRMTICQGEIDEDDGHATGHTPLVAAMRAYVASKFGEEVPDEVK